MADAKRIDGKAFAAGLQDRVKGAVTAIHDAHAVVSGLAVVLVGEDPASEVYVRNKGDQTRAAGMNSFKHKLPADVTQHELMTLIHGLNHDNDVDGILVQLPLPGHLDEAAVLDAIDPEKDVDGFHAINTGRLWSGVDALVPCTPYGCLLLLKDVLGDGGLTGKRALVVGRSNIVGKPMAALLLGENATVTIAHSRTVDLADECRRADVLVVAAGQPHMVPGDWIKPGATVIDVGIHRVPAPERGEGKMRLIGDVKFDEAKEVAGAITPVPGGVGPMTIACLLRNTVVAGCRRRGFPIPPGL